MFIDKQVYIGNKQNQCCFNVGINKITLVADGLFKLNNLTKIKRLTAKEIEQLSTIDDNFCFSNDNTLIDNVRSIKKF